MRLLLWVQVVQDRLVHAKGTAVFAAGLARAISRLRSLGGRLDSHKKGRVLRAVGLCVSKALQAGKCKSEIVIFDGAARTRWRSSHATARA